MIHGSTLLALVGLVFIAVGGIALVTMTAGPEVGAVSCMVCGVLFTLWSSR